jgi:hypothetical protein
MRTYFKMTVSALFFLVSLLIYVSSTTGELIEPTQTLEGEQQPTTGRLTILSEPPEQKIMLDGKTLGKTPIFLVEIEAGVHSLRVADSKTDIYVEPGKTLKVSLFKNEFVFIPVKEKEAEAQPEIEAATGAGETTAPRPRDPVQVRVEENREQAQERWQRYVDGSRTWGF